MYVAFTPFHPTGIAPYDLHVHVDLAQSLVPFVHHPAFILNLVTRDGRKFVAHGYPARQVACSTAIGYT